MQSKFSKIFFLNNFFKRILGNFYKIFFAFHIFFRRIIKNFSVKKALLHSFVSLYRFAKSWILARSEWPIISVIFMPMLFWRLRKSLQHAELPSFPHGFTNKVTVSAQDIDLTERLILFWHSMKKKECVEQWKRDRDVWTSIIGSQSNLIRALDKKDAQAVAEYLVNAPATSICQGILQGDIDSRLLQRSRGYRKIKERLTSDRYVSLLESVGILSIQNPEQGSSLKNMAELNFEESLRALDIICGTEAILPQIFGGLFVSYIGGRAFNQVDIMALHSALRLKTILRSVQNKAMLEIGGGSGRVAYWCARMGLGPLQIIDLPHVSILQAWFLIKALPTKRIYLYGESGQSAQADISLYPDVAIHELNQDISIAFNQDSLPEMSKSAAVRYLNWIACSKARWFLSVNHESAPFYDINALQLNPMEVIRQTSDFSLVERQRNWIRGGYVDGLYVVNSN